MLRHEGTMMEMDKTALVTAAMLTAIATAK